MYDILQICQSALHNYCCLMYVGASCGAIVFTVEACKAAYEKGQDVILVRHETSPEDIMGLQVRGEKQGKKKRNSEVKG